MRHVEINCDLLVFGDTWNRTDCAYRPEDNTTVLGLWLHWDPANYMMHPTVHLCEYVDDGVDEDENYGWHRIDSYKAAKGDAVKVKSKKCVAPTFWCEVKYAPAPFQLAMEAELENA